MAVVGGADASPEVYESARRVGALLAEAGIVVATGGRSGVMEAASRGAVERGGTTLGILPGGGLRETPPNPYVVLPVFTGLGDARNAVLVRTGEAVIAVSGGFGTLSEIGLALKAARPVALLGSWTVVPPSDPSVLRKRLFVAPDPESAVAWVLDRMDRG